MMVQEKNTSKSYMLVGVKNRVIYAQGLFKVNAERFVAVWNSKATGPQIDAAHDMYEALKELLSVGDIVVHDVSVAKLFPNKFKKLKKALEKAEGRT
jgi:hypothetical protein